VEEVKVRTPSQPELDLDWVVAHRKSAIAVAPQTEDGRFVMVEQERVPVRRVCLEFPAGQIDDTENRLDRKVIVDTVTAELKEEVGYALACDEETLRPLGYYFTSQGFTDEHIYLFHASSVVPLEEGRSPDPSERILGTRLVSAGELRHMIAENEIVDSLTLALFARMTACGILS
jgi:8-oxo-dGTP pyrophosphatase MutT (NUDIX family)